MSCISYLDILAWGDNDGDREPGEDPAEKAGVATLSTGSTGIWRASFVEDAALFGIVVDGMFMSIEAGDVVSWWVRPCFLRSCERLKFLPQVLQVKGFSGV